MNSRQRGNPRFPRMPNRNENWRNQASASRASANDHSVYGSHSSLISTRRISGDHEDTANQIRQNRTSSTGSEQSYERNRFCFNYGNRGQRGGFARNNFSERGTENTYQSKGRRPVGFKVLESLLEKDPEQLLLELSNSKRGFIELIESELSEDTIILFVKILKKVVESSFDDTKAKVLQMYFDGLFVKQLINYIVYLPMQDTKLQQRNRYFWKDPDEFWYNLIIISQHISGTLPTFSRKVLPALLKSLIVCFGSFEVQHSRHISDEIKEKVKKLSEAVEQLEKEYEENQKATLVKKVTREQEQEPPDDFRQIDVYPESRELVGGIPVFLRRNVVKGAYRDVNHYLDVQFRLLREDFVGPLRNGISAYRSEEKKRPENVKIHKRVRFLNPETANEQYCIRLCFDLSRKKREFKYENSKRFMFGSLLCFTADNFRSIIFGKVAQRELTDLKKSEIIVGFDQNTSVLYDTDYVMVECSVYFEPYYHVLKVLQNMSTDGFPMEKYIIHIDSTVRPPAYLEESASTYSATRQVVAELNKSQLAAFKAALTQEFCIIQGPPGTGKTFLGLKIAQTILQNYKLWYKNTPMLVICYTNHALDQFLEGITQFTTEIVRVGGQSKNENLKSYNLRDRQKFKMSTAFYQQRDQVQTIVKKIKVVAENLKQIEMYHSVRAFDVFEDVVPNFKKTWFARAKRVDILRWLLGKQEVSSDANFPTNSEILEEMGDLQIQDTNTNKESESEDDLDDDINVEVDDLFDNVNIMAIPCSIPLLTLSSLQSQLKSLESEVTELKQIENPTYEELIKEEKLTLELTELKEQYNYLNDNLIIAKQKATMKRNPPQYVNLNYPFKMQPNDRWKLYFYWLNLYKRRLREKLDLLNQEFRTAYKGYEQIRDIENTNSMKNVLVIGMTTTGAARLRSCLQALKSPIVIVEEAAEVLEAHIVTSLTPHCKHLILIGDHQQLKPSTANYNIEQFYNLGISLFERMVINKIQLYSLNVQHRMRPEISSLIAPAIYPQLQDHPSVMERPTIKGVDNCLFFIHHTNEEDDCEGTTKKNYHEVSFLIHLAKHLVLNGYKPENITILAAYLGQMFELQKEKKKHIHVLENVRIAVLDNYQGEECDIILLSLVRNNTDNKVGFLKIDNRVCVALSRARNGFYIMGNIEQLCASCELWTKIRRTLDQQNAIGTELPLRCQIHNKVTYVKTGNDFLALPEGGCDQKCAAFLVCGHTCTITCHIMDRDHENYKCRASCNKRLCEDDRLHLCRKMCYQDCGPCDYLVQRFLSCGHTVKLQCHIDPAVHKCMTLVSTKLPCGHIADKPCHSNPMTYRCPHPCEIKVEPCGHACAQMCHVRKDPDHLEYKCKKKCARYRQGCTVQTESHLCRNLCYEECESCTISVRKNRTLCPHVYDVPCSSDVDELVCQKPCKKILACGHKCKNKCHEPCGICELQVEKANPVCGHLIKVKCYEQPDRRLCNKQCPLKLPCGHSCTKKCNEPCTNVCKELVSCVLKAPCGHTITRIKCYVANSASGDTARLLKHCNYPCTTKLKCGHSCSGTCGECFQGRVHKACKEKCGFPLICNHPCSFPCRQACRPCARPCSYRCKHSTCSRKCGDVCTSCKEKCGRSCRHRRCTQLCGEICNVLPCKEPCPQKLQCGHNCIGFCGDPCPMKCLICDKEELTTIFFGMEDEMDARFVALQDCGHIFESEGIDGWMKMDQEKIGLKECPRCKTPITTTQRYSDIIKKTMEDVAKVKQKFHGDPQQIKKKREELMKKLNDLKIVCGSRNNMLRYCPKLEEAFEVLNCRLLDTRDGRRQLINKPELNAITSKSQVIEHIVKIYTDVDTLHAIKEIFKQINFLAKILMRDEDYITDQEIADIQLELNRLSLLVKYDKLKKNIYFSFYLIKPKAKLSVNQIEKLLYGFEKFSDLNEDKVRDLLKQISPGLGISDKERREIIQAMGFKQGHWYKCPKGHPYAIGECGGAMVEATCPECGAKIGGTNHALLAGNAVATEMDGARYAAWSDAANMANYQIDD